jgi:DNA-3-methyladenine glycosylase
MPGSIYSLILSRNFYRRPVQTVARELLGKRLVRQIGNQRAAGYIIEAEAYDGEQDQACHARSGKTRRNAMMYGEAGRAYVYFTYGMHWMLNCVSAEDGYPAAVLIRALHPVEGLDIMNKNRTGVRESLRYNGPAKLTRALEITGDLNGIDLCDPGSPLRIEDGIEIPVANIQTSARVGIQSVPEPWLSMPWRFFTEIPDNLKKQV